MLTPVSKIPATPLEEKQQAAIDELKALNLGLIKVARAATTTWTCKVVKDFFYSQVFPEWYRKREEKRVINLAKKEARTIQLTDAVSTTKKISGFTSIIEKQTGSTQEPKSPESDWEVLNF